MIIDFHMAGTLNGSKIVVVYYKHPVLGKKFDAIVGVQLGSLQAGSFLMAASDAL